MAEQKISEASGAELFAELVYNELELDTYADAKSGVSAKSLRRR